MHYGVYFETEEEIVELYLRSENMEVEEFEQLLDHMIYYDARPWHPDLPDYRPLTSGLPAYRPPAHWGGLG